ncbi:hypothetical protein [uncultured Sphingomonas sp.]|uniref:hypothetical protein n=1 Tax=uncultured Sphingomonas sp. TaxID=158754 RepID=UPI0035CA2900
MNNFVSRTVVASILSFPIMFTSAYAQQTYKYAEIARQRDISKYRLYADMCRSVIPIPNGDSVTGDQREALRREVCKEADEMRNRGEADYQIAARQAELENARSRQAAATRAAVIASTPTTPGSPSPDQIGAVMARSHARYYNGTVTQTIGEDAVRMPTGAIAYYLRRKIFDPRCVRAAAAQYRCSYTYATSTAVPPNSIYSGMIALGLTLNGSTGTFRRADLFVRTKAGWSSPTIDQTDAREAAEDRRLRRQADVDVAAANEARQQEWNRQAQDRQNTIDTFCAFAKPAC